MSKPGRDTRGGTFVATLAMDGMSTSQRIAWGSLLALVFLVPLAISKFALIGIQVPLTFDQFDVVKTFVMRVCVVVGLAAWAWHILVEGGRWRRSKADYLVLAVLGWVALTTVTSIHPLTSLFGTYRRYEGLLSFIAYAGAFFLAIQMLDRASRIRVLAKTFFWSSVAVNFYGVMQYLGIDPADWGQLGFEERRAFSTYGNPELLAGFVVMSIAVALALALAEERQTWRGVYWSGFVLALACWIATFTRGAWIGGVVAMIVMVVATWRSGVKLKGIDKAFLGGGGVLAALLVALSLRSTSEVMNVWLRVRSILDFSGGSVGNRFKIWEAALDAIADQPIFGFGADTFRLIFPRYRPLDYVGEGYLTIADNVHNYPLQVTTAFGVPGLLLMFGLFGYAAWVSAPLIVRRSDAPSADRLLLAGFWAACAGYITHLFFALSITGTTVLLWICMAVVLAPTARSVEVRRPQWGQAAAFIAAGLAVLILIASTVHLVADNRYMKAKLLTQGMERAAQAEAAARIFPYESAYVAEVGIARMDLFIETLLEMDAVRGTPAEQSVRPRLEAAFLETERAMLAALEFSPWEYENYIFLANLYSAAGDYLDAQYYDRAVSVAREGIEEMGFRYDARLRFQLARALHVQGQSEEAFEHIKLASELAPDYLEAQLLFAEIARATGEPESAREAVAKALELYPGDPRLLDALAQIDAGAGEQ